MKIQHRKRVKVIQIKTDFEDETSHMMAMLDNLEDQIIGFEER